LNLSRLRDANERLVNSQHSLELEKESLEKSKLSLFLEVKAKTDEMRRMERELQQSFIKRGIKLVDGTGLENLLKMLETPNVKRVHASC